jgi:hypothetical protein
MDFFHPKGEATSQQHLTKSGDPKGETSVYSFAKIWLKR